MLDHFFAELRRSWTQSLRYFTEWLAAIVATTLIFYGLFLGATYMAGPGVQFGDRLSSIIVGYVLWTLVLFVIGDIAGGLQNEAQTGTLEQLFLSPQPAPKLFLVRALASLTIQLTLNFTILLVLLVLTHSHVTFSPLLVFPFVAVLLGAYGLAFAIGSLALVLKRVQQLLSIIQFALLFLLTVPAENWTGSAQWLRWLLPMAPGAGLLREVMAEGEALDWRGWAIAFANGCLYLAIGLALFRVAERAAKRQGRLAGY